MRIDWIKRQIRDGYYETQDRIDATVDRLLPIIMPDDEQEIAERLNEYANRYTD